MTLPQTGLRIDGAAVRVALWLLFCAVPLASSGQQVFKGEIAGTCAGPAACGKKGTHYVLSDSENKTVYQLDNQRKPKAFAGMQVVVIGTLDEATATIHVSQMFRALPPKVMQAETVAIVCDACLRDMAEAKPAALKALEDWGRFEVRPNPKHVDLIFLLSANPYLGDYVTRDGPDTRPVHVDITFMNVIDPRTGESLWGDSRQWGSWFVARATKDLMAEFREQLEAGDHHAARLLFPRDGTRGGGITKQEFLDYMAAEFQRLDRNKDGKLDDNELKQLRLPDVD